MKVGGALHFERLVIHSLDKRIETVKLPRQEIDKNGIDFDRIKMLPKRTKLNRRVIWFHQINPEQYLLILQNRGMKM